MFIHLLEAANIHSTYVLQFLPALYSETALFSVQARKYLLRKLSVYLRSVGRDNRTYIYISKKSVLKIHFHR